MRPIDRARDALFKWYDARLNVCVKKVGLYAWNEGPAFPKYFGATVSVDRSHARDALVKWYDARACMEQLCVPIQCVDLDVKIRQQLEPKNQSSPQLVPHLDA